MAANVISEFRSLVPAGIDCTLRLVNTRRQTLMLRRDNLEPVSNQHDQGAFISVDSGSGRGYAATSDTSRASLKQAIDRALDWAQFSHSIDRRSATPEQPFSAGTGFIHRDPQLADPLPLDRKIDCLQTINRGIPRHPELVDWWVYLECVQSETLVVSIDNEIQQCSSISTPALGVVANRGGESQKRTFGLESGLRNGFDETNAAQLAIRAEQTADEARQLLAADQCPNGTTDLLLMPDQMILQIHESIGHPLELDRILGDERNYAGTSFVTLDMFGEYQYGTELLNITFDPTVPGEIASYHYDDEGNPARREYLIRDGRLLRPIGSSGGTGLPQIPDVAARRASSWNRPPIDRMGNINLEPGTTPLQEMIESVENGVLMETNRSWSIDDSRNKFQFGCEFGRMIRNGQLAEPVKNPNYRGISSHFWRSLKNVGDADSFRVLSVPACGKGEPNQGIKVGHASPPCLFSAIDVFGGHP